MDETKRFPWIKASQIACSAAGAFSVINGAAAALIWLIYVFFLVSSNPLYRSYFTWTIGAKLITVEDLQSGAAFSGLPHFIALGVLIGSLYLFYLFRTIRKIMVQVEGALVFSPQIGILTNRVGWLLMAGWGGSLLAGFVSSILLDLAGIDVPWTFNFLDNFFLLLCGILVRTLGEIFRHGVSLQDETEGMV